MFSSHRVLLSSEMRVLESGKLKLFPNAMVCVCVCMEYSGLQVSAQILLLFEALAL